MTTRKLNRCHGRSLLARQAGRGPLFVSLPALVIAGLLVIAPSRSALGADFVLIQNAKTGAQSVTHAELKELAIGKKKTWPSGGPVQLVLEPPGTPELRWFAQQAAGTTDETLYAKIKQEVFKGELRRPVSVTSDKDCVSAVAADPGAMGVVSAETAKSLPAGVTVLAIQ